MTLGCRIAAAVKRKAGTKVQQSLNANSPHFSKSFFQQSHKKSSYLQELLF